MSDVTVLKRVILDSLAMVNEAVGEAMGKPGRGWGPYCGADSWSFLSKCVGIKGLGGRTLTMPVWDMLKHFYYCTEEYRSSEAVSIKAEDVMSTKKLVTFERCEEQGEVYYFPVSFQFEGGDYALNDFIEGNPLPWDRQGEVCTQSAHSTNPVATLENALNQADFKRKEEVMRKFKAFSSALTKSDFVPPWDRSAKR